jgi:hypothetical protein
MGGTMKQIRTNITVTGETFIPKKAESAAKDTKSKDSSMKDEKAKDTKATKSTTKAMEENKPAK